MTRKGQTKIVKTEGHLVEHIPPRNTMQPKHCNPVRVTVRFIKDSQSKPRPKVDHFFTVSESITINPENIVEIRPHNVLNFCSAHEQM